MPPPDDGNESLPFEDLIKLERINALTYKSIALAFSPGGQLDAATPRSYGGHVFMQAAWAACQTVDEGFLLYNVVGHFHLPGSRTIPFVYKIDKIRDGRSYATRNVTVTLEGSNDICFTSTCSFKRPEAGILDVQAEVDLWQDYSPALQNRTPESFEEVPGMDVPWYWKLREETGKNDSFPGLQCTKADMTPYNKDKHPLARRNLIFYRPLGAAGLPREDPNLHLCAHLYASDRNSLYIVTNQLEVGDLWRQMSSLMHTVIFHSSTEDLMFGPSSERTSSPMDDTEGSGRWFCKEDFTTRAALGRAVDHARIFNARGRHVATVLQDGMVRFQSKPEASREEVDAVRERQSRWKPLVRSKGKL